MQNGDQNKVDSTSNGDAADTSLENACHLLRLLITAIRHWIYSHLPRHLGSPTAFSIARSLEPDSSYGHSASGSYKTTQHKVPAFTLCLLSSQPKFNHVENQAHPHYCHLLLPCSMCPHSKSPCGFPFVRAQTLRHGPLISASSAAHVSCFL